MGTENEPNVATEVVTSRTQGKLKPPAKYQVVLLNDDYTPMDFVVEVLQIFFFMTYPQAVEVMLVVHKAGRAVCGVYSRDVAETKVVQVNGFSKKNESPNLILKIS